MNRKRKDMRKKRHQIFKLPNLCGKVTNSSAPSCSCPSVFGFFGLGFEEKFPTAEFWMISAETPCWEIHRKKITKFLMRTFSGCSTFLYSLPVPIGGGGAFSSTMFQIYFQFPTEKCGILNVSCEVTVRVHSQFPFVPNRWSKIRTWTIFYYITVRNPRLTQFFHVFSQLC